MQAWANTVAPSAVDGFAEPDDVGSCDQPRERLSPFLQRPLAEIIALEAEKVEGDQCGLLAARLGAQSGEVGMSVRAKHDRLAVDQGVVDGQGANRVSNPSQSIGEVRSVPGPQAHAIASLRARSRGCGARHVIRLCAGAVCFFGRA